MNDVDRLLQDADVRCATFRGAGDAQLATLVDVFVTRAGRDLTAVEIAALVELRHKATCCEALVDGLLTGQIVIVGQRENGEFVYSAA